VGAGRVWVELGRGDLVRADAIVKICAGGERVLSVKVTGEREPRELALGVSGAYPQFWDDAAIARFEASLDPVELGRGLIDAMASAAQADAGSELRLWFEPDRTQVCWRMRYTGSGPRGYTPGASFWDFSFANVRPPATLARRKRFWQRWS